MTLVSADRAVFVADADFRETGTNSEVYATNWLRSMKGQSNSHLLLASGRPYVVKFQQNTQSANILANEWLASQLARVIGLPVPDSAVVHVSNDFLIENPEVCAQQGLSLVKFKAGRHFGSLFVGGIMPGHTVDYLPSSLLDQVEDKDLFWGALAFDKWVCNTDARQCVFTKYRQRRSYSIYFIDHGHCFDLDWGFKDAPRKGVFGGRGVYREVCGRDSFDPWLTRIEAITEEVLWKAASSAPGEWYDSAPFELPKLIDRLYSRRVFVWQLIEDVRRACQSWFPGWLDDTAVR